VLAGRAVQDTRFATALEAWRAEAERVPLGGGTRNRISGGTFHGPVLQGHSFSGVTFGSVPAAPDSTSAPGSGPDSASGQDAGPFPAVG
jgi:hypothetical protein